MRVYFAVAEKRAEVTQLLVVDSAYGNNDNPVMQTFDYQPFIPK